MKCSNKILMNLINVHIILIIVVSSQCMSGYETVFGKLISYISYFIFFSGMILLYFVFLCILKYKGKIIIIKNNVSLIILVIIIFGISIKGSLNLSGSILNIIFFIGLIFYSVFIIYHYSQNEVINIIILGSLCVAILNIIYIFMFPQYAYQNELRFISLRGSFVHRNNLASFMSISCIFSFIALISKDYKSKRLSFACFIICFYMLINAHSSTSLVCFFATIAIVLFIKKYQLKTNIISALLLFQIAFYTLITNNSILLNKIFVFLGRDPTLTGRVKIWVTELTAIYLRPLLGYGYGVIWDNKSLTYFLYSQAGFNYGEGAHSGIIELLLEIGLIGAMAFTLIIIVIPSYKLYKIKTEHILKNLAISMFVYILIYTLTEKSFSAKDFQTFYLLIFVAYINKNYKTDDNVKHLGV